MFWFTSLDSSGLAILASSVRKAVAFDPYAKGLLQPLSCLVAVVTKQDSEKCSLPNNFDKAGSGVDPCVNVFGMSSW